MRLVGIDEPAWQHQARNMTPAQFARVRKILGLSKSACARFLGLSLPTIQRYSRGDYPIPASVGLLLILLVDLAIAPVVPRKPRKTRKAHQEQPLGPHYTGYDALLNPTGKLTDASNQEGPSSDSPQPAKRTSDPRKPGN